MAIMPTTHSVLWLTGPPCSGKTTIAAELHQYFGKRSSFFDGDTIRNTISKDLQPGPQDREKNLNRVLDLIKAKKGISEIVIAAFVSPDVQLRALTKERLESAGFRFILVHVSASPATCMERDVKGLYKKFKDGDTSILLPGFNDRYDIPLDASVICNTDKEDLQACVKKIIDYVASTSNV
ncbi:MAG: adenylyl-sulfate kinase [Simkania sp.]|nr:adenylyl-sulfate kinase [Simkania sp.]